jgi:hypothetical protein
MAEHLPRYFGYKDRKLYAEEVKAFSSPERNIALLNIG